MIMVRKIIIVIVRTMIIINILIIIITKGMIKSLFYIPKFLKTSFSYLRVNEVVVFKISSH